MTAPTPMPVRCPFATDMACPANPPCPTPHERACLGDDDQEPVPGPWLVGVFCDHPDCPADDRADYLARTRADAIAALRRDLNARGWLCDPAADWCPEHRP